LWRFAGKIRGYGEGVAGNTGAMYIGIGALILIIILVLLLA
jgi:hypothetical protein